MPNHEAISSVEKIIYAVVGFVGGLLANLIKLFAPSYVDLHKENLDLREKIRSLEDAVKDMEVELDSVEDSGKDARD